MQSMFVYQLPNTISSCARKKVYLTPSATIPFDWNSLPLWSLPKVKEKIIFQCVYSVIYKKARIGVCYRKINVFHLLLVSIENIDYF